MKEARSEEFGARPAHRRGDVEGLRALAVLGVLLFHVGGWGFRGGFVGVDVFLVISGYLITGNLLRARTAGTVMLGEFYARRVVRILPVLLVVLATTLIYATVALLPVEIRRVGESAAAAAASVSNIYFYATTGYFAAAGEAQPLLHSWSLGVEEQFYLAYPLLLLWLTRGHRSPRAALLGIGVLSFALGTALALHQPAAGFYLLPARAWELALGAWLAAGRVRWRPARWRGWATAGGVALILLALVAFKPELPFPAPFALLPCAGTALVLAFGDDTRTGALLGGQPLRWIGTISYSVYLWHWPIVTFYRLRFGTTLTLAEATMLLAASLVVGVLSFVLIERPAMRRWRTASPSRVIASAAAAIAITVTAGLSTASAAEWLHPTRPQVSAIASFVDYERSHEGRAQFRRGRCFATDDAPQFDWARCLARQRGRPTLLVMGDSYAAQYWRALAERFPRANVLQATAAGCRPLVGAGGSPRCAELMRRVFADSITTGRVDAVVLAGRWLAKEDAALARTIAVVRAHGIAVTVIGPAVEYDGSFPLLLARGVARDGGRGVDRFRLESAARERAVEAIAREARAGYHSITVRECPHEQCRLFAAPGVPVHFDNAHVTLPAARYLMRDLAWPR